MFPDLAIRPITPDPGFTGSQIVVEHDGLSERGDGRTALHRGGAAMHHARGRCCRTPTSPTASVMTI